MTTMYNTIVTQHKRDIKNHIDAYKNFRRKIGDIKGGIDLLEKNKAVLEAGDIKFDFSFMHEPYHTLPSGEIIPRLVILTTQSFDHVIETMTLLGWCAVRNPRIPNCAVFDKYNTRIFLEMDHPF